jgi:hypothetical protein
MLVITVFICLGLVSEGLACHTATVNPTSLTYNAVVGATSPPNQTIAVSRTYTSQTTLTDSDNASWLSASPATTSMTTSATLTAAVNTSGLAAGTYSATTTIKVGTWCTYTVPATLILSPATSPPPPPTTSTATLTWNAVTGATITGYKVYYGVAPQQYTQSIDVGNVTSSTVNSLTVGTTYYFVVTAYNSAGESSTSNEVSKSIY